MGISPPPQPSLTWTPPLSCPDLWPREASTPPWTPLTRPAVSWTPTSSDPTIAGFQEILAGKYDHLPEVAFYMVGNIDEVVQKAERLAAERGDKFVAPAFP